MGLIRFQPARQPKVSEYRQVLPTAAVTLLVGAPVQRSSADPELIEEAAGTSTVTGILGVAQGAVTAGVPTWGPKFPIAIADPAEEFIGQIWDVSAGVVATAVKETHEGVSYGMIKISGNWYIDEEDTSHIVLRVTRVFTELNAALFKWLPAAVVN